LNIILTTVVLDYWCCILVSVYFCFI